MFLRIVPFALFLHCFGPTPGLPQVAGTQVQQGTTTPPPDNATLAKLVDSLRSELDTAKSNIAKFQADLKESTDSQHTATKSLADLQRALQDAQTAQSGDVAKIAALETKLRDNSRSMPEYLIGRSKESYVKGIQGLVALHEYASTLATLSTTRSIDFKFGILNNITAISPEVNRALGRIVPSQSSTSPNSLSQIFGLIPVPLLSSVLTSFLPKTRVSSTALRDVQTVLFAAKVVGALAQSDAVDEQRQSLLTARATDFLDQLTKEEAAFCQPVDQSGSAQTIENFAKRLTFSDAVDAHFSALLQHEYANTSEVMHAVGPTDAAISRARFLVATFIEMQSSYQQGLEMLKKQLDELKAQIQNDTAAPVDLKRLYQDAVSTLSDQLDRLITNTRQSNGDRQDRLLSDFGQN